MAEVTFFKNQCPHCNSTDVTMAEENGEKVLKCNKCNKLFAIKDAKKVKVGKTNKM